jgi:signal transduction histidine kinase
MVHAHDFEHRLREINYGDHVCMIYENRDDQLAAVIPFIAHGLSDGDCCLYIADDQTIEDVMEALSSAGVDVEAEQSSGALQLLTKRDSYLKGGEFDPREMIDTLYRTTENAVRRRFTGFRVTGEMTWALGDEVGCDRLIEYEALLNRFFPGTRAMGFCQYNRQKFPAAIIRDVLRTHPHAVLGLHICTNLYYEPPDLILNGGSDEDRVHWMIRQLKLNEQAFSERRVAEEKLKELDRKKDELLAILGHGLRNPLAPMRTAAAVLRMRAVDDPVTVRCSSIIESQLSVMAKLLTDILDLTQISNSMVDMGKAPVELVELVNEMVSALSSQFQQKGVSITPIEQHELVEVAGDRVRLGQVISILLENALKFTDPGGSVRVSVETRDGHADVSVSETGIGIEPEHLRRVFEKFTHAHSNDDARQGLGIGLAICKGIVDLHGGTLDAESDGPGRGSTFRFSIPLLTPEAPAEEEPIVNSADTVLRFLVADDNKDSADTMALLLETLGAAVRVAYDGHGALLLADEFLPEVVLLDLGMPGIDGYEVCKALRSKPWGKEALIIAQTGWGRDGDRARTREAGFDHHLVKPIDIDEMLRIIPQLKT